MSILDYDAARLSQAIRDGEITSVEATETYIAHLKQLNPSVRCLVEDRFDEALAEAAACDERLRAGEKPQGRLFGVPMSLKEAFDMEGMHTTGGMQIRKDFIAKQDAEVVARLKREGAIFIGKTNTPELCFCQETDNKLFGRTNNPWDLSRTVGGSSGGEGALIAIGGAAAGLGADIGGSIRYPSHFNGAVGFKSGNGQVSEQGLYPPVEEPLQLRMLGIGGITKSVRDARLINEIVAEEQPPVRSLQDYEVVIPTSRLHYPASPGTVKLLSSLSDALRLDGMTVWDEQPPLYKESALLWQMAMSIDGAAGVKAEASGGEPFSPAKEWLKEKTGGGSKWHRYLTWALIGANMFKPSAKQLARVRTQLEDGDRVLGDYFESRLLILPVYHTPALPHGQMYKQMFSVRKTFMTYGPYMAYANTWGLPSLTLPAGEENGLPIGVQIIGGIRHEDAIFTLGERLERSFRGWKRANPQL